VIIYEGGVCRGEVSSYIAGDTFRVQTVGGVVSYLQNGGLIHTSANSPTVPLLLGHLAATPTARPSKPPCGKRLELWREDNVSMVAPLE